MIKTDLRLKTLKKKYNICKKTGEMIQKHPELLDHVIKIQTEFCHDKSTEIILREGDVLVKDVTRSNGIFTLHLICKEMRFDEKPFQLLLTGDVFTYSSNEKQSSYIKGVIKILEATYTAPTPPQKTANTAIESPEPL